MKLLKNTFTVGLCLMQTMSASPKTQHREISKVDIAERIAKNEVKAKVHTVERVAEQAAEKTAKKGFLILIHHALSAVGLECLSCCIDQAVNDSDKVASEMKKVSGEIEREAQKADREAKKIEREVKSEERAAQAAANVAAAKEAAAMRMSLMLEYQASISAGDQNRANIIMAQMSGTQVSYQQNIQTQSQISSSTTQMQSNGLEQSLLTCHSI